MIEFFIFKKALSDMLQFRRIFVWLAVIGLLYVFSFIFVELASRRFNSSANELRMAQSGTVNGHEAPILLTQQNEQGIMPPEQLTEPEKQELNSNNDSSKSDAERRKEFYVTVSGWLVFKLLALVAAIFSSMVISQEIEQKTIVYLLTRPIKRSKILLSRAAAAMVVTLLISTLGALAVSAAVFGGGFLSNELLWRDLKGVFVGSIAYVAFFVLISLWLNKAMLLNLIFAFGWEAMIPNMMGSMYKLSIYSYLSAIAERPSMPSSGGIANAIAGALGTNTILPSTAYIVMTLFVGFCLWFGSFWFSRFEYVPREDAD